MLFARLFQTQGMWAVAVGDPAQPEDAAPMSVAPAKGRQRDRNRPLFFSTLTELDQHLAQCQLVRIRGSNRIEEASSIVWKPKLVEERALLARRAQMRRSQTRRS